MSNVVKVKRLNKTLNIDEGRLDSYLLDGYDQIDEEGNIITRATGGRNVSLAELNAVLAEKDLLVTENDKLKSENSKLKAENSKLKKSEPAEK
ncbi:hypothetical protein [Bacillus mycoides]|uniref:hypothetical protein n=1 Tax=Bacillus mycoides TaxID=1405 RepID=UPI000278B69A|nr:hypothetical protein [Bacillus mycoides]MBJ7997699.1 hypothetical protein [Bacillus cereus]EJQ55097.1 hypothetical protein IEW_05533 [Bacillus mycoides]EJQ55170.1 hypothetical protein IEW_05606 [Bacillus mycoides]EJQ57709.1 hypothetical protein IEY_05526 [Bacillus mycoides]EJQ57782.1 hypothetical protein IEY_05599 [Bacillus mycoides]